LGTKRIMDTRICTKCKTPKALDQFLTYKYKGVVKPRAYCTLCTREKNREYMNKHKHVTRGASLKRCYGITTLEYEKMFLEQEGKCKICDRKRYKNGYLYVDHCHQTGKVRGLLCSLCNSALGMLDDSPILLQKALNYVKQ
jgi:hypothetical protein